MGITKLYILFILFNDGILIFIICILNIKLKRKFAYLYIFLNY